VPLLGSLARTRAAYIAAMSLAVLALTVVLHEPGLGLTFLYIIPTLFAAYWFGWVGGVATGAAGAGLFLVGSEIETRPVEGAAALVRLLTFCLVGIVVARLLDQRAKLSATVRDTEVELSQLRAMHEALTPPAASQRPSLSLASAFEPAQEGVAGDFFMVAEGPADATIVVVGDVVGKGLEAARRASFVRTALTTFAPFTDNPCRLLEMANASLIERAGVSEVFVTATCVAYRPAEACLSWASAGHPPPVRLDDGTPLNGVRPGLPLGVDLDVHCSMAEERFVAGSGLVLFTDGLSEARDRVGDHARSLPAGGLFGDDRIRTALASLRGAEPSRVVEELAREAKRFSGGALSDDLCIVALRAAP